MKRCMKCNAEIEDDAKFCVNCGSVVEPVNDSIPTTEQPVQGDLAIGAEGAQALEKQQSTEKKKKRFAPKVAMICVAGLLVVCILVVTIYKFLDSRKFEGVFYLKNGDLRYGTGKEDESYKLIDRFIEDERDIRGSNMGYQQRFGYKLSDDHRYVYYANHPGLFEESTYYWRDLSKVDKEDEVEISDEITGDFSNRNKYLVEDGSKFFYIEGYDASLYVYDRKTDKKEKLDDNLSNLNVNKEGNYLIYQSFGSEGPEIYELSLKNLSGDPEIIDRGARIGEVNVEEKQVYYYKDGDLYFKEHETKGKKLISDVLMMLPISGQNVFYFIRQEQVNHKLSDYVTDDLLESDSKMLDIQYVEEPESPKKVDENDFKTIKVWNYDYYNGSVWNEEKQEWGYWGYEIDYDAYNKAYQEYREEYDEWLEECEKVREENAMAVERYQAKQDRDRIRERLNSEENEISYTVYSLYYWDGSKEHKIADDISNDPTNDFENCYIASDKYPSITYRKYKADAKTQVTMSQLYKVYLEEFDDVIESLKEEVKGFRTLDEKSYLAYKETVKSGDFSNIKFMNDNKVIFIEGEDHILKSVNVTNLSDDAIVTIDKDVKRTFFSNNGQTVYYMKDVGEGKGDLYKDKKKIASNVEISLLYIFPESDSLLYMEDYYSSEGTLYLFKDNKETKISKDVAFFCPYSEDHIALLKDYEYGEGGDLELYKKGKLIPIDKRVDTLLWTFDMGELFL